MAISVVKSFFFLFLYWRFPLRLRATRQDAWNVMFRKTSHVESLSEVITTDHGIGMSTVPFVLGLFRERKWVCGTSKQLVLRTAILQARLRTWATVSSFSVIIQLNHGAAVDLRSTYNTAAQREFVKYKTKTAMVTQQWVANSIATCEGDVNVLNW